MPLCKIKKDFKTKSTYSSEDELTVKILISTMLMMQTPIPGGLQNFSSIVMLPTENNATDILLT